jgi:putative oxidoreductase
MQALQALRHRLLDLCRQLDFLPPLLARVVIGVIFTGSGWGKLHALERVTEYFAGLGLPFPELQAPFVASTELLCGALVLVGLATRLAALPLICVMGVALATALSDQIDGLGSLFGLAEFLYLALLVGLVVGGAGALSLDRFAAQRLDGAGSAA